MEARKNRDETELFFKSLYGRCGSDCSLVLSSFRNGRCIPKNKIVVFTGVSGSGKSSIVFDTVAAESQRQMNETYSAWVRGRLPKYEKPLVDTIENLNPSVIIDQSRLGGNARSTVGTISDMYSSLRLLFSRIGSPSIGPASYFSFNNPNGMCPTCMGIGKVMDFDVDKVIDKDKTYDEGMFNLPAFGNDNYYWKVYRHPEHFRTDVPWKDLSEREQNFLLYGSWEKDGERVEKKVEGVYNQFKRLVLMKSAEEQTDNTMKKIARFVYEHECPDCRGLRLNREALSSRIKGYNIAQMCDMEFSALREVLSAIEDPRAVSIVSQLTASLDRMIDIGLPYLSMNRESSTLSGGEAQRLKLVRYMGSSLCGMIYIFDEPSTGMHPRDVHRMARLLKSLRDKGNTVLVVEHDKDIISIADEVIDIGPLAGKNGGEVLFQGSYEALLLSDTRTGRALSSGIGLKAKVREPSILPEEGYIKCPEFWNKEFQEKHARLWATMVPETPLEKAILDNEIGLYAICDEKNGYFKYWIAGLYKGGEVPSGLSLITFPEGDWATFSAKGPLPDALQRLNTQVWEEWYPVEGERYEGDIKAMVEVYSRGDMKSPDYRCGLWVPVFPKGL